MLAGRVSSWRSSISNAEPAGRRVTIASVVKTAARRSDHPVTSQDRRLRRRGLARAHRRGERAIIWTRRIRRSWPGLVCATPCHRHRGIAPCPGSEAIIAEARKLAEEPDGAEISSQDSSGWLKKQPCPSLDSPAKRRHRPAAGAGERRRLRAGDLCCKRRPRQIEHGRPEALEGSWAGISAAAGCITVPKSRRSIIYPCRPVNRRGVDRSPPGRCRRHPPAPLRRQRPRPGQAGATGNVSTDNAVTPIATRLRGCDRHRYRRKGKRNTGVTDGGRPGDAHDVAGDGGSAPVRTGKGTRSRPPRADWDGETAV